MSANKNKQFKSGFITLVGRPNAGKSTLLNALVENKVAITSNVAQTTRHRLRAILNTPDMQAIFVDTPGIHKPHDVLGQELNASTFQALNDVDIVVMLFDVSQKIGPGDRWIVDQIKSIKCPHICVFSKCDLADANDIPNHVATANLLFNWDSIVCLSSVDDYNLDAFKEEICHFLKPGPVWFPEDMITDQQLDVIVAEYIREKIIRNVFHEVPHSVGVAVDEIEFDDKKNLCKIYACAYVERESQKGILIGKGGETLKKIGTESRKDLEKLFNRKIYLDLSIKVRKNWRRDLNQIRKFGYNSE